MIDLAKIPSANHGLFTINAGLCTSTTCSNYDYDCKNCAAQPSCGYCLDTNRCMPGTATGPIRGICGNWRFKYDNAISRVVTVDYVGTDLVNPDYEVYLASSDDISVSLYVPTGNQNDQWDIVFLFQTTGSYSVYAASLKSKFMQTIESTSITSMNLNLGIGMYNGQKKYFNSAFNSCS
jgi:hypothetical protein